MAGEALALHGGSPVRDTWLPYGRHLIDDDDVAAVTSTLQSLWLTQGPTIAAFERAVAELCEAQHGVAFSSGTAALHAACAAAGLKGGDEAITTPLTFAATANAVIYCGAAPRFSDICGDTLNINPAAVEKLLTPRTRAILPVDFAGQPADLDPLMIMARDRGLIVIEDASHALGARYHGRRVGTIADMTVLSFHPVKHVTTGEGGLVLTNDNSLADRLRTLRHHGIDRPDPQRPWLYEISTLGYNYRITDIQCALGLSQLRKLNKFLAGRREIASLYISAFKEMSEISLAQTKPGVEHAWHIFVVLLNLDRLSVNRDTVIEALRAENIGATVHYPLVHLHPYYRRKFDYQMGLCPVAEALFPRLVTLPLFPAMTEEDFDHVVAAVRKVCKYFRKDSKKAADAGVS